MICINQSHEESKVNNFSYRMIAPYLNLYKVDSTTKCKLRVKVIHKNFQWGFKIQFFSWSIV